MAATSTQERQSSEYAAEGCPCLLLPAQSLCRMGQNIQHIHRRSKAVSTLLRVPLPPLRRVIQEAAGAFELLRSKVRRETCLFPPVPFNS